MDSNTEEKGPTVLTVMLLQKWMNKFCFTMHCGFVSVRCTNSNYLFRARCVCRYLRSEHVDCTAENNRNM